MTKNIKVLHEVSSYSLSNARITRVIQYNGVHVTQKFKLIYDLRNGMEDISVYIMNSEGEFRPVLNKYDLGHTFNCSYVSTEVEKKKDAAAAIKLAEGVIIKIW